MKLGHHQKSAPLAWGAAQLYNDAAADVLRGAWRVWRRQFIGWDELRRRRNL
jgi:hypothetical protein